MTADQSDLFETQELAEREVPLAERLRPESLADLRGQEKLISKDSMLAQMIETGVYHSFILWGPPGSGKTTIARIIKRVAEHRFIQFSAVLSGITHSEASMCPSPLRSN